MWDITFWATYLDHMARYQYNMLSLWSLSPWPSIVEFTGKYAGMSIDDVYRADIDWVAANLKELNSPVTPQVFSNLKLVKKISISEKVKFWQRVMQMADDRGIKVMLVTWNVFAYPIMDNETKHGINVDQTNPETIAWVRHAVNLTFATYPLLAAIATDPGEHMKTLTGEFSREE